MVADGDGDGNKLAVNGANGRFQVSKTCLQRRRVDAMALH
jgi:hypothetical protein